MVVIDRNWRPRRRYLAGEKRQVVSSGKDCMWQRCSYVMMTRDGEFQVWRRDGKFISNEIRREGMVSFRFHGVTRLWFSGVTAGRKDNFQQRKQNRRDRKASDDDGQGIGQPDVSWGRYHFDCDFTSHSVPSRRYHRYRPANMRDKSWKYSFAMCPLCSCYLEKIFGAEIFDTFRVSFFGGGIWCVSLEPASSTWFVSVTYRLVNYNGWLIRGDVVTHTFICHNQRQSRSNEHFPRLTASPPPGL